VPQIERDL
jgi:ATP-dependent DNA helicase RecG